MWALNWSGETAGDQLHGNEFSMHGFVDDRLDVVILDALFEQLL